MLSKNKLNRFDDDDDDDDDDKTIPMIEYNDDDKTIPMIEYNDEDKTIPMIEYNDDDDVGDDDDNTIPKANKDIQIFCYRKSKRNKENGDGRTRQIFWAFWNNKYISELYEKWIDTP